MRILVDVAVKITPLDSEPLVSIRDFIVLNTDFTVEQTEIRESEGVVALNFSYEEEA